MSTYEYTDTCGEKLEVEHRPVTGMVMVSAYTRSEIDGLVQIHVNVSPDDAPALALAVLEAAGIKGMASDDTDADKAVGFLRRHEGFRKDRAEREAEDAKVQEWLDARNAEYGTIGDHWNLDDAAREGYRASKAFWEKHLGARKEDADCEVMPNPRVIEAAADLDAEHWTSKWKDTDGCTWEFTPRGWGWRTPANPHPRITDPESFPWTEVLV